MASGDLHALGVARIERSGELDLSANPVWSVLSGPVGTGEIGWPSRARGVETRAPEALRAAPVLPLDERNGFSVLDFDRNGARVELLRCPEGYVRPSELRLASAVSFTLG
jgi:hypothetical protein